MALHGKLLLTNTNGCEGVGVPVSVVTSCSAAGWEKYGRRFLETFSQFWPTDVHLYFASEDALHLPSCRQPSTFIDLNTDAAAVAFLQRNISNHAANGLRSSLVPAIRDKYHGYNFRMDAFRFSKKVFAIKMAADLVPDGRLIWLDADVVTTDPIPHTFLQTLPPLGYAIAYLSRKPYHSECGFVGYDLDHAATRPFIKEFYNTYVTDAVFKLREWNDCFVFDHLRKVMAVPSYPIPHMSITHPFVHSVLGNYMDHLKGKRKERGVSPDHPKLGHLVPKIKLKPKPRPVIVRPKPKFGRVVRR